MNKSKFVNFVDRNIILVALTSGILCAAWLNGCASAAKTTFQTISTLNVTQQTLWTAYVNFRSSTPVPSNVDSNVVKVFSVLKTDELAAIDTTTNGGTFSTTLLSTDLGALLTTLQSAGVKNLPAVSTNL
jgi:hypothetical protein